MRRRFWSPVPSTTARSPLRTASTGIAWPGSVSSVARLWSQATCVTWPADAVGVDHQLADVRRSREPLETMILRVNGSRVHLSISATRAWSATRPAEPSMPRSRWFLLFERFVLLQLRQQSGARRATCRLSRSVCSSTKKSSTAPPVMPRQRREQQHRMSEHAQAGADSLQLLAWWS